MRNRSHGSTPWGSGNRASAYLGALRECARVAREEGAVAEQALGEVERVVRSLKSSAAEVARGAPNEGPPVADAVARLRELVASLDATVDRSFEAAKAGVTARQAALQHFTVTLFGRTLAGKSTLLEALTGGDGATIGNGGQPATREARESMWSSLRVLDTPGIRAFERREDRERVLSVLRQTDVALFVVSSDGLREDSLETLAELRRWNKPLWFVLNVKRDLCKPVHMRRFLADPRSIFDEDELRGHRERLAQLAGNELGMREVRVFPIHAQAAYLSMRPEHREHAEQLAEHCGLDALVEALEAEVLRRGSVRRVQTLVDGTVVSLLDLQETLTEHSKTVKRVARGLKAKFRELDTWFESFAQATNLRAKAEASLLVQPLRATASAFIDETLEKADVAERWNHKVKSIGIEAWLERQQAAIREELRARLAEFSREAAVEMTLIRELHAGSPSQFDPWDVTRSIRTPAAPEATPAGQTALAAWLDGTDFWNPLEWLSGETRALTLRVSWRFGDRDKKPIRQKSKVTEELRGSIDELEHKLAAELDNWFQKSISRRFARAIRSDTRHLFEGMFAVARSTIEASAQVGTIVEHLNRRLLVRSGEFVGVPIPEQRIARVIRDPGMRAKVLWQGATEDARFAKQVGGALGEGFDGVPSGALPEQIAAALQPATVAPSSVSCAGRQAMARVAKADLAKAVGPCGVNVSLASRLLGVRIRVVAEGAPADG